MIELMHMIFGILLGSRCNYMFIVQDGATNINKLMQEYSVYLLLYTVPVASLISMALMTTSIGPTFIGAMLLFGWDDRC
jgi:hypothetical protein